MTQSESNWHVGMLILAAGFAAWSVWTFLSVREQAKPTWWGVVLLALASLFCALRARRRV
jgi:hypothetical protein